MSITVKINENETISTELSQGAIIDIDEIESVESTEDKKTIIRFKNGIVMKVKKSIDDILDQVNE